MSEEALSEYENRNYGIYITGMGDIIPAKSFAQGMAFTAEFNLEIMKSHYPTAQSNDALAFASLFVWNSKSHGEHDPDSVDWNDPF